MIIGGSSDANEVRWAKRILPLRSTGNLLLCTLLLGNTLVNALIAILLADMTSGTVGAVATTLLIVMFGEIGPQAACSRYALQIGAAATPLVWVFVVLMFPFAYPVSKVLDYLLGGEVSAAYQRSELVSLIKLNVENAAHAAQSGLTANDGKLLTGALTYKEKLVSDTMTPMKQVFALPDDAVLDWPTVEVMLTKGHSRVPVFKADDPRVYVGVKKNYVVCPGPKARVRRWAGLEKEHGAVSTCLPPSARVLCFYFGPGRACWLFLLAGVVFEGHCGAGLRAQDAGARGLGRVRRQQAPALRRRKRKTRQG